PWRVVAIHAHVLPDGRVASWERKDSVLTTETWLWTPVTENFQPVMNRFASEFCAGHTFLGDGRLFVAGGHHFRDGFGEKTLNFFDWRTNSWTKGPDMNAGRWYPNTLILRNGDVLVTGGSIAGGQEAQVNPLPQVWQASTNTFRDLTGALQAVPLYPMLLLAPDGRAYMVGPDTETQFLDTSGTGDWQEGPDTNDGFRDYGSAVEYRPGKILLVGGGGPTATAETIDLNVANPKWALTAPMSVARRQLNATLLPDGTVLVTGGSSAPGFNNADGAVLTSEIWDPDTGRWTTVASQSVRRLYHSTAVLLHDGRVLSAGGGMPPSPEGADRDHRDAQIYSPAYLFRGERPVITKAPEWVTYGQRFYVDVPYASNVARVTWIRLSSVTHAFNHSQRFNELAFARTGDGQLTVTAPSNKECPPGPYLLFVLNARGVPSVGKVVFIR
ncbi:MAG TPA: galactose oxidase-like domain-containing protein, partial [Thermoanaerobaculia bacterium]